MAARNDITLTELGRLARLLCGHVSALQVATLIERVVRDHPDYASGAALLYLELGHPVFGRRALAHLQAAVAASPTDVATLACVERAFALMGDEAGVRRVQDEITRLEKAARESS